MDEQQLLYHTTWPHGGDVTVPVDSMNSYFSKYPNHFERILVFDKKDDLLIKDHERQRRGSESTASYNLTLTSQLPSRDALMKIKNNKKKLSALISSISFGSDINLESQSIGAFLH